MVASHLDTGSLYSGQERMLSLRLLGSVGQVNRGSHLWTELTELYLRVSGFRAWEPSSFCRSQFISTKRQSLPSSRVFVTWPEIMRLFLINNYLRNCDFIFFATEIYGNSYSWSLQVSIFTRSRQHVGTVDKKSIACQQNLRNQFENLTLIGVRSLQLHCGVNNKLNDSFLVYNILVSLHFGRCG